MMKPLHHSIGFTLIEVLIGVTIGMVGILAVFQTMMVWDAGRRTATTGSDAQVTGAIALMLLERDIRMAGMGFSSAPANIMGCTVSAFSSTRAPTSFTFPLLPIQIVNGDAGAPDQIIVLFGNSSNFVTDTYFRSSTANTKVLDKRGGILRGDVAIVTEGTNCAMLQVTGNTAPDESIEHNAVSFSNQYLPIAGSAPPQYQMTDSTFNPAGGTGTTFVGCAGAGLTCHFYDFGRNPVRNIWRVRAGPALAVANDITGSTESDVGEGVVDLQAEYGVDANNNGVLADAEWTTAAPTDWTLVRAVRVAVLTRSAQAETIDVTTQAPRYFVSDGVPAGRSFVMSNLDGSAGEPNDANNWRRYRYRVFERLIPLRNLMWGQS